MGTTVTILILLALITLSLLSIRKRIKYGSSCCGTKDAPPKRIPVQDKNKAHYPYTDNFSVDGMHCKNCARIIENSLNSKEGIWASVNLEKNTLLVRSKNPFDKKEISQIVSNAGYSVTEIN